MRISLLFKKIQFFFDTSYVLLGKEKGSGAILASTKVVVLIPKAVATPHDEGQGSNPPPKNVALDASSSPRPTGNIGADNVLLRTIYVHWLKIQVNDQFGASLDKIYEGQPVVETNPINQAVKADGTYLDPVGSIVGNTEVERNSQQHLDWIKPTTQKHKIPGGLNYTQNLNVWIGGHALNPAIQGRTVYTGHPNSVTIVWPN